MKVAKRCVWNTVGPHPKPRQFSTYIRNRQFVDSSIPYLGISFETDSKDLPGMLETARQNGILTWHADIHVDSTEKCQSLSNSFNHTEDTDHTTAPFISVSLDVGNLAANHGLDYFLESIGLEKVDMVFAKSDNTLDRNSDESKELWSKGLSFLNRLQADGKIKYIGIENANDGLLKRCKETSVINAVKNNLSILNRKDIETGFVDTCEKNNITYFAFEESPNSFEQKAVSNLPLKQIALKHGLNSFEISIAWLLLFPHVIPIPLVDSSEGLESICKSVSVDFDIQDLELINQVYDSN